MCHGDVECLKSSDAAGFIEILQVVKKLNKCKLLDWFGGEDIVAEGELISKDPKELINLIPLGPNAMKIRVVRSTKPEAFLWRPTTNMSYIQHAEGETIAWPAERVIMETEQQSESQDNI